MIRMKFAFVLILLAAHPLRAQTTYRLPPAEVVDIIDAKPTPSVVFSPDTQWMLLVQHDAMPSIADVSRRMLRLAGIRIDPVANGWFRTSYSRALALRQRDNDVVVKIPLSDARIGSVSWAHDSSSFVFTLVGDTGTELWYASVHDPRHPRRLSDRLTTLMGGYEWMPDAKSLLCWTVPTDRGAEPVPPSAPSGPSIQESAGYSSPTRTYQDLLSSPFDEKLFEYFATVQLAVIDIDGAARNIGRPAIISEASVSPAGEYLRVTTIHRPFSYLMTYRSFPQRIEVWDLNGKMEHLVADIPMAENIPIEGVRTGPRRVVWKSSEPATLMWLEALDGGDPHRVVDHRDRWMVHEAPFKQSPRQLLLVEHRGVGVAFFADPSLLITTEYDRDRRWTRTLLHDLSSHDQTAKVLDDRSVRDRYADPGRLVSTRDQRGRSLVRRDGSWCYLAGAGASPDGLLPFLDRLDLETLQTERLWRCTPGSYESFVAMVDSQQGEPPTFVTSHETQVTPPNFRLRNLAAKSTVALTRFPDPIPQIRRIRKQLITYERDDGVRLSATLYLPADYQPGTRLPLIVWAYPREYNDPRTAGQIGTSDSRFTRMQGTTHLTLLTQGYAIMDAATMPVIGEPETMNDTFIEQIVASAQAAIDKAVELGVADRNRVGVGGHSYGAFMTANLLAHGDLFHAGVARSGAYNRTLTPFGFQSERRPLWQAKSVYFQISPFLHAHKINEPILLIHGENDNNPVRSPCSRGGCTRQSKGTVEPYAW